MKRAMFTIGAALAIALGLSTAQAQSSYDDKSATSADTTKADDSSRTSSSSAKLNATDRDFVQKATVANLTEIRLGQLAADKASSADVKQRAQKMVDDHTKVNDDLKKIADQEGATAPADLDAEHKAEYDKLNGLSGADFDREYVESLKKDHRDAVSLFQTESRRGSDPALKEFATNTLPSLREHLQMASNIRMERNTTAENAPENATPPPAETGETTTSSGETRTGGTLPATGSSLPTVALAGIACLALAGALSRLK